MPTTFHSIFYYMIPENENRWARAERLNGRLAMIGFLAAIGAYINTGSIW